MNDEIDYVSKNSQRRHATRNDVKHLACKLPLFYRLNSSLRIRSNFKLLFLDFISWLVDMTSSLLIGDEQKYRSSNRNRKFICDK